MNKVNVLLDYFDAFRHKSLDRIKKHFREGDISLIDWNVNVSGEKKVLYEIEKIFDSVKSIIISPLDIKFIDYDSCSSVAICKLDIHIENNNSENISLRVLDIISFRYDNIIKIEAYKQC